jgi:putative addiction module CopG family antidote
VSISLTPELAGLVNLQLATGQYHSVEDVLTAALRALSGEQETLAAIHEGHDDALAGRVLTLEEADEHFFQKYGFRPNE